MWITFVSLKRPFLWKITFGILIFSFIPMTAIADETIAPENWKTNLYTGDLDAIAAGKSLWKNIGCYSCHGQRAEGGVGPNLSDDVWVYKPTDKTLYNTIARGRSGTNMVGWSKELSPGQIWQLVAFIRSLYIGDPAKIIW